MTAPGTLLLLLTRLLTTSTPAPHCFLPTDQTAGWKRVTLPGEAPALAAPADLAQFRSGELATLTEQDSPVPMDFTDDNPGRRTYRFTLPSDANHLEVGFLEDLQGAKVDAWLYQVNGATLPLLSDRRLGGTWVSLNWNPQGVSIVSVTVHHHLRARPVVRTWRVTRVLEPGQQYGVPEFFRVPHSLYYFHPGHNRRVELCEAPGQQMRLARPPDATGVEVQLTPP